MTPRKTTPKKRQITLNDSHTRESSNVDAIEVPLLEENKKAYHRQRGISIAIVEARMVHCSHKSSSLGHNNQKINTGIRDNNEGCVGYGDGGDPL
jgi:hypothetical protein